MMKIDPVIASDIVRAEADAATVGPACEEWVRRIEEFSTLCENGSKTHVALLGTAMLAKAVDDAVDLFAFKPTHNKGNPRAFSARTLCHGVLVPLSAELGFSLGVTGREPLNNQPYFRMTRLDDGTPVHPGGKRAFDYMLALVHQLAACGSAEARQALRAFISVRRKYQPYYVQDKASLLVSPDALLSAIETLTDDDSEGGRRAQAIVAGLIDVFAGPVRVESGRINDPSRHFPGDVCVKTPDLGGWEKALEVRDKPVSRSDVQIFVRKCADSGVRDAAVVMCSQRQKPLDHAALGLWAQRSYGIGLTLFDGWEDFVQQVLYWSELPKPDAAIRAAQFIRARLIAVEVHPETVVLWQRLARVR